jgi:hypothetical protein
MFEPELSNIVYILGTVSWKLFISGDLTVDLDLDITYFVFSSASRHSKVLEYPLNFRNSLIA